jgi:hypothetical protein
MPRYFNYFPKTLYTLQDDIQGLDAVTNIVSRYAMEQEFKENSSVYYKYNIQDSDTPEIIANKFYESPERHWLVLMMNDMLDPNYDWPLDQRTIIRFINSKYTANANTLAGQTGLEWAQLNTHSYYKIEKRVTNYSQNYIETKLQIDANTYANVAVADTSVTLDDGTGITIQTTKESKSYYDFEIDTNESKREIKLLKPEFAFALEQELQRVFSS